MTKRDDDDVAKVAERRRHPRMPANVNLPYTANVDISCKSFKGNFIVGNISYVGLGIIVPQGFEKFIRDLEVDMTVNLFGDREIKVKGIVRHLSSASSKAPFVGIEFVQLTDDDIRVINQYFKTCY